jgi:methionine-rich copper-binding protein CopC
MSPQRRRPSTRRRSSLGLLLIALCALFVAAPSAAFAHDELIGSTPADGELVETAPTEIDLRFSAEPLDGDGATDVLVIDPLGAEVQQGAPVVDRNGVIQGLSGADERGTYTVVWRVVSSDGHPISGELTFSVGETSEPADLPSTTGTGGDTGTGETEGADTDSSGGALTVIWVVVGIVAAGLGGALIAIFVARVRGRNDGV